MRGITLDTGALIALERGSARMTAIARGARGQRALITVPAAVLAEWWRRGGERMRQRILNQVTIEPTTGWLAQLAGEAAGEVGATGIDAIVMASAAQRGDVVFTSDFDDLDKLRQVFPRVTVLRC
jgi:predicted nucleic acid-binding protein